MSHEGYTEYLCERGHYFTRGRHDARGVECPTCRGKPEWEHAVDTTSGARPAAKLACARADDVPLVDHHGDTHYVRVQRYRPPPLSSQWERVSASK